MYFDNWFERSNAFFREYHHAIDDQDYITAIFLLHQTVERYFMTILLVHNDYKPRIHELDVLDRDAGIADVRFKTVFPRKTAEERLFTLLKKAYIDSRYQLGYW